MVSPELIRRYRFFAGLEYEHIVELAKLGEELSVENGHVFFREGELLDHFYLILEGAIAVVLPVTDREAAQSVSDQLMGTVPTKDVLLNTVEAGEVFGWAALLPPHQAEASVRALVDCRVIQFDGKALREKLEEDCRLGFFIVQRAAQVLRDRLKEARLQLLSHVTD